jgi:outer membrane protein insertion porin family
VVVLAAAAAAQDRAREDRDRWLLKRPVIDEIVIEGNDAVGDGDIRDVMELSSPGFWARLGLRSRPRAHLPVMRRDEESVRREYRRRGFWTASVRITAEPSDTTQSSATVRVVVQEGKQSFWGNVAVDCNQPDLGDRLQRIATALHRGRAADSLALAFASARMYRECANRAHPAARIGFTVQPRQDSLDVDFSVTVGPFVKVGDLEIVGLKHTRENVVRREVGVDRGDPYSRQRLDDSQQDVYATGLFTFVHLQSAYAESSSVADTQFADLRLRVVERRPSFIGLRTGIGQDELWDLTLDYAGEWGSRNWLGTGRKWTLTAQSGFVVVSDWRVLHHRFSAKYVEPWIFGQRLPTTLEIAFEPGVRAPDEDYRIEQSSAELGVTRRFRRYNRISSSLILERVRVYGASPERAEELLNQQGISIRRRWSLALERDTRPNIFIPTSGAHTRLEAEYAGGFLGGQNDFYKVDFSWSRYQVVSAPSVFASRFRVGWARPHGDKGFVPFIDRFKLGGANSIRGYAERSVGPLDSLGAPIGGEVILLGNLELRTPVKGKFWFTLFGDAGNNWSHFRDINLDDILVSIGIGWEYLAPVGPIRLDYARRVVHPGHPTSDRLHLSILFAF